MRRERRYGSFSRSMVLPKGANTDDLNRRRRACRGGWARTGDTVCV